MSNWQVAVDNSSFDSAGITKDCQDAICEYIWNGFEAQAHEVCVRISGGDMENASEIEITDNGTGIKQDTLKMTFGAFLSSEKRHRGIRIKSQMNKGRGRFSYIALSHTALWDTTYSDGTQKRNYRIELKSSNKANVSESDLHEVDVSVPCGTTVRIPISDSKTAALLSYPKMAQKLLEEFAWYLYLNQSSGIKLTYCGYDVPYTEYIDDELSSHLNVVIDGHDFTIDVIVWRSGIDNNAKIYYLNSEGEICDAENTSFNKNAVEFHHSVFVRSSYFSELPTLVSAEDESFVEYAEGQKSTMKELKKRIHALIDEVLHAFLLIRADRYLEEVEVKACYPRFSDDEYGRAKKKDFANVTRELYCVEPRLFYKLQPRQTKSLLGFLALLLDSDERENVIDVVEQIVSLSSEQREKFSQVLRRTKLENIIDMVDVIQQRYQVVHELRTIVYDKELSHYANERDHLQKIIENHYWLFGDQYYLVSADVTFRRSLEKFEEIVSDESEDEGLTKEELRKRMDVFLYAGRVTESGEKEGLIIELKAPHVTLASAVYSQIEKYANMVRKEPQFSAQNRKWKFYAVCSRIHDDVSAKFEGYASHGKKGLVGIIGNFEIYAMTWDDIFLSFEMRYRFLLERIQRDFDESADSTDIGQASKELVTEKVKKLIDLQLVQQA